MNENIAEELTGELTETVEVTAPSRNFWAELPRFIYIMLGIAAASVLLMLAFMLSEDFADFYNRYIGSVVRAVLAYLTGWLPCSLAEAIVIFLPVALVALIIYANRRFTDSWRDVWKFTVAVIAVASMFFSIFALGFGAGYHASSVDELLGLDREDVSAEELEGTAALLAERVNEYTEKLVTRSDGASVMPYNYDELSRRLCDSYSKVCEEYPFISRLESRVKPVILSEPWTYTHIAGVYTFFTGEANININFPDYTLPFTAAHELAHQRGIAREDEANFVAFLVCINSDDEYIRYSGYINMFEYVGNALYSADSEAYSRVLTLMERKARLEMSAYNSFFEKYRHSVAADITETVNDTYLTIQGTPGTKSYGMVVDLAVAYLYRDR